MNCGHKVLLVDPDEILECVREEHPGDPWHSTGTHRFQRVGAGRYVVSATTPIHREGPGCHS